MDMNFYDFITSTTFEESVRDGVETVKQTRNIEAADPDKKFACLRSDEQEVGGNQKVGHAVLVSA